MKTRILLTLLAMALSLFAVNTVWAGANVRFQQIGTVIIAVDNCGKHIQAKLKSAVKSGDLTFSYEGWSLEETAILRGWIADMYPLVKQVYGLPAFANQVKVVKDSSGPYYNNFSNEIGLPDLLAPDMFCHEMVHSFHDDLVFPWNAFEEGMARAVEVYVMSHLPVAKYPYGDRFHSSTQDDIWYEGHNTPAISCTGGNFSLGSPLVMARDQQAGYALGKCLIEDPGFFLKFNLAYYAAARKDPTISGDLNRIKSLMAQIRPSVEGKPFAAWFAKQRIFDFAPKEGYQFFLRGGTILYAYFRHSSGYEYPLGGFPVNWEILDYRGYTTKNGGSGNLTSSGWINIPTQVDGYIGKIVVNVTVVGTSEPMPIAFATLSGNFTGIFGTVPGAGGSVKIHSPNGKIVTAAVSNGLFMAPSLEKLAGQFTATYQPLHSSPVSKRFTKDAASYYVNFD